jgi:hypothetical protein
MKKVLLTNGDSWTFGSEIMAPEFCVAPGEKGEGQAGRFKPGYDCWQPCNDYYRVPRTWPTHLGTMLDVDEVVNISRPGRSNDTIYESTIAWIIKNYISKDINTKGLRVVIGWSSPERKNIIIENPGTKTNHTNWYTLWPAMPETTYYESPVIQDIFKFYVLHQNVEQEYIKRFVEQAFQLQTFCERFGIKCYMFNAFYARSGFHIKKWHDLSIIDTINNWNLPNDWHDPYYDWDTIKESLIFQWSKIQNFINKDRGTFLSYINQHVPLETRMCNYHPSPESHLAWATYLREKID